MSTHGSEDAEELEFAKLNGQDLSSFDCTVDSKDEQGLQEFIQKQARGFQQANLGTTYLVLLKGEVVAFVTLAMTSILVERMQADEKVEGVTLTSYPALLVGRLAVDRRFRRRKLGTKVCSWCLGLARGLSSQVGCRYIVLHAKRDDAISFYKNNFFVISEAEEHLHTKLLYRKVVGEASLSEKSPSLEAWTKSY